MSIDLIGKRRCARFAKILQNCVACQVFGRMCLIVFLAFTLKFPIQTSFSVAHTLSLCGAPHNFSKTNRPIGSFLGPNLVIFLDQTTRESPLVRSELSNFC